MALRVLDRGAVRSGEAEDAIWLDRSRAIKGPVIAVEPIEHELIGGDGEREQEENSSSADLTLEEHHYTPTYRAPMVQICAGGSYPKRANLPSFLC